MRAFVVEDDQDFRDLVRDALEEQGWTVDVAEDGIAALGRIRRVIPDLLVLDVRMPNLDGIQVLKLLRSTEVGQRIPVLVMTGAEIDPKIRALATAVLRKPFTPGDLLRAVAGVTGGATPPPVPHGG
jgi:DNA-binding response OmpR family regulator